MSVLLTRIMSDNDVLLTDKEAAEMLRLANHKTLANWRCKGKHKDLEYIRIGRSIRYRVGSVRLFMANHMVGMQGVPSGPRMKGRPENGIDKLVQSMIAKRDQKMSGGAA